MPEIKVLLMAITAICLSEGKEHFTGVYIAVYLSLSQKKKITQEATVRTGDGTTDWFQIGK